MTSAIWRVAARSIVFIVGSSLAACLPALPSIPPVSPTLIIAASHVAQATAALPATASLIPSPTEILPTGTAAFTPVPSFTPTVLPGTALTPSLAPTQSTPTAATLDFGGGSVGLEALPPGTIFQRVRLLNRSHAQADISLHCTTSGHIQVILEYEGVHDLTIHAPEGKYIYVVYVGGRQIVGSFSLQSMPSAVITIYADRVRVTAH